MENNNKLIVNNSDNQKLIRTICTIIIIFVHLGDSIYNPSSPFLLFTPIGYLCVGVFFFFTGYNLISSFKKEYSINNGFISNKIKKILIPSGIANVLYGLIIIYYSGRMQLIKWAILVNLANTTIWYIDAVLCIYFIYFILFSILSLIIKKYKIDRRTINILIAIFSILVFIIYTYLSTPLSEMIGISFMQNSSKPLSLIIGMLYAIIENKAARSILAKKWILAIASCALLIIFHKQNMSGVVISCLFTDNLFDYLAPVFFVFTLYFMFFNVTVKSKLIDFIYGISLEIYVLHYFFLKLFRTKVYIGNDVLYMVIYLTSLIVGAYLLSILKRYICKAIDFIVYLIVKKNKQSYRR